jgi:hypothetical protein
VAARLVRDERRIDPPAVPIRKARHPAQQSALPSAPSRPETAPVTPAKSPPRKINREATVDPFN